MKDRALGRQDVPSVYAPPLLLWASLLLAAPVAAADSDTPAAVPKRPTPPTRIYAGMWTSHILRPGAGVDANALVGASFRGYFAGTFINSYGGRAFAGGIQRTFRAPRDESTAISLGYRMGLVTGYDDQLLGIGDKVPALPFAQLTANLDYRNVGLEVGYAGVVASFSINWRF